MKSIRLCILVICYFNILQVFSQQKSLGERDLNSTSSASQKKALVLGNQHYNPGIGSLVNIHNDVDSMSKVLSELGFQITKIKDLNRSRTLMEISSFVNKAQRDDVLFFYYSGHGLGYEGENYIVPVDFKTTCIEELKNQSISLRSIQKALENKNIRNLFMVIDACRNNGNLNLCSTKSISPSLHLVDIKDNPVGHLIAFATDDGKTSSAMSLNKVNSLYTESLLKFIKEPIEVKEIFNKTNARTYQISKILNAQNSSVKIQEPVFNSKIYDDFYFTRTNYTSRLKQNRTAEISSKGNWDFKTSGPVKTNGPLGTNGAIGNNGSLANANYGDFQNSSSPKKPSMNDENLEFGKLCFSNKNMYSRNIVLINTSTNEYNELMVGNTYSGTTVINCDELIKPGNYKVEVYTTFSKKLVESFTIRVGAGSSRTVELAPNQFN